MKRTFALIVYILASIILFGQNKIKTEPFIIKGQITDCPEKYLNATKKCAAPLISFQFYLIF